MTEALNSDAHTICTSPMRLLYLCLITLDDRLIILRVYHKSAK